MVQMAKITDEDILKLAELSNLEISDDEVKKFQKEIQSVMEYIDILSNVDTTGVEPTNQVTGLVNATREDEIWDYAPVRDLLKNVPEREGQLIKVKRVLE